MVDKIVRTGMFLDLFLAKIEPYTTIYAMEDIMRLSRFICGTILAVFATSAPAMAHEFWLDAHDYMLESGQELRIDIRVGQDFKGNKYSFNPNEFFDFSLTDGSGKNPIEGRIGDRPAVSLVIADEGLLVLNHFSTSQLLTYDEFEMFESFVRNKGLDWVLEKHVERGLPVTEFGEGYTRFAKSLIAVGQGAGSDALTGMPFELLALKNPYTDDISDGLPVRLFFGAETLPDIQIDIFQRSVDQDTVVKTHVTTDETGTAVIPVINGNIYLINAVHMIIPSDEDTARTTAVWHSLWASMTFQAGPAAQ